jgi:hypothetical protein
VANPLSRESEFLILTAFSKHLQARANAQKAPEKVLYEWLAAYLLQPPAANDTIARIIHTELAMIDCNGHVGFEGRTDTGSQLLQSLYQFCRSYDHWQFTRWVHDVQASDFSQKYGS